MSLKRDVLLGVWTVFGIFSIYIGILQLRYPDAAWKRVADSLTKKGLEAKRTARWDRSRVFTGTLTSIIGCLLIVMAGWVAFAKPTEVTARTLYVTDPSTGKIVEHQATAEEMKQYYKDPAGFVKNLDAGTVAGSK